MTQEELNKKIELHKKWLADESNGEKLILINANLRYADFNSADLRYANLSNTDLRNSDLRNSDLSTVNLENTNLRGANLDYSSWPLWCGSLKVTVDSSIRKQLAYHLLSIIDEDMDEFLDDPIKYANGFHRSIECGEIKYIKEHQK